MADKKEYQSRLKLLDATTKVETTANKLGQLGIDAEDPQIKEAATKLAAWLRRVPAHSQAAKYRVIDMAKNLAAGSDEGGRRQGTAILEIEPTATGSSHRPDHSGRKSLWHKARRHRPLREGKAHTS